MSSKLRAFERKQSDAYGSPSVMKQTELASPSPMYLDQYPANKTVVIRAPESISQFSYDQLFKWLDELVDYCRANSLKHMGYPVSVIDNSTGYTVWIMQFKKVKHAVMFKLAWG